MAIAMTLAGGSWIFLGFVVLMFFALVYTLYTVRGSMITKRPYGKIYSGAPGARGPSTMSGHDQVERVRDWQRGTR